MIQPTPFISQEVLSRYTMINDSVDFKFCEVAIMRAQWLRLRPILGECLYDRFVTDIIADNTGASMVAAYKTLLDDYVIPCLLHMVLVELLPALSIKIDNSNLNYHIAENTSPIEPHELNVMVETEKNHAAQQTQRLIAYLCENSFTEYDTCTDDLMVKITEPFKNLSFMAV